MAESSTVPSNCPLPRVTIQFCTQCKWMLRAAYFAQELLSTFSTALGEVALQPSTGGTFIVTIYHQTPTSEDTSVSSKVLWDRKVDGGFPETKELKRRVRDVVEPGRDLGHVDRGKEKKEEVKGEEIKEGEKKVDEVKSEDTEEKAVNAKGEEKKCEDCV